MQAGCFLQWCCLQRNQVAQQRRCVASRAQSGRAVLCCGGLYLQGLRWMSLSTTAWLSSTRSCCGTTLLSTRVCGPWSCWSSTGEQPAVVLSPPFEGHTPMPLQCSGICCERLASRFGHTTARTEAGCSACSCKTVRAYAVGCDSVLLLEPAACDCVV